jgi:hypothetical protein
MREPAQVFGCNLWRKICCNHPDVGLQRRVVLAFQRLAERADGPIVVAELPLGARQKIEGLVT